MTLAIFSARCLYGRAKSWNLTGTVADITGCLLCVRASARGRYVEIFAKVMIRSLANRRFATIVAGGKTAAAVATTGILPSANQPRQGLYRAVLPRWGKFLCFIIPVVFAPKGLDHRLGLLQASGLIKSTYSTFESFQVVRATVSSTRFGYTPR